MTQTEFPANTSSVRWSLVSLGFSMLLSSMGISITNVALPTLAEAFSIPFQNVQWIVLAYLLSMTVVIVIVGRLGDILGRRRVLLSGIALFTGASLACGLSADFRLLIAARGVQGIGAAVLMAMTVALVRETFSEEKTGGAMGVLGTMSAVGTAFGPSVGGMVIGVFGWQSIFVLMTVLGTANFFMAYWALPMDPAAGKAGGSGFDAWGTFLMGAALLAYCLAVTAGDGDFGMVNLALLAGAVLGGWLFFLVQGRVAAPLIRLDLIGDGALRGSLAMNVLVATVMMTTLVVGPFYLSGVIGLGPTQVGLVMSAGPMISIFSGVPAGRLVDHFGAFAIVTWGLAAMVAGAFALALLPKFFGVLGYLIAIVILTPGYQLFQAANNTAVMVHVAADSRGVVSGLLGLSRNLGLITGASVMGVVFILAAGVSDLSKAAAGSLAFGMQVTFATAGCLMIVALGIAKPGRRR